jgi:hypothetical protein
VAADLLVESDPDYPDLMASIARLARGASLSSLFNLKEDMMCRRGAAVLLANSADGLRSLGEMLGKGDTWEKHTALYALDDFTEVGTYSKGGDEAVKILIPIIAGYQTFKDKVLNGMSREVLDQIAGGSNGDLSALAKKLIAP